MYSLNKHIRGITEEIYYRKYNHVNVSNSDYVDIFTSTLLKIYSHENEAN